MKVMFKTLLIAASALSLFVTPSAEAGQRHHTGKCTAKAISKTTRCQKKTFRKALPQQEMLQPLYVDPLDPLLVPPLQGVLNEPLDRPYIKAQSHQFSIPSD